MIGKHRLRRLAPHLLTAALALVMVGCVAAGEYPNTTFEPKSELGRAIDFLWDRMLLLGTIVFVLTELALLIVVWRYRHRGEQAEPRQIHGNTKLEILWTLIPAVILVFIAIPTVRTIFETQAPAPRDAIKIEVIGHQWWWEFRYPDYNIVTANELYLPTGRTVNFELKTKDVLHSFWIPQLGAKRDLISNRTNYVWFTTDSTAGGVWNGFCTEYCGASHANMHFRVFTVTPEQFESWAAWQAGPAAFSAATPAATPPAAPEAPPIDTAAAEPQPAVGVITGRTVRDSIDDSRVAGYFWPAARVPVYAIPTSPLPDLAFNDNLVGNPARGQQAFLACIGCHTIRGNPMAVGTIGPDLTHVGSRLTIAAGMFPNDTRHLVRWIKNAPRLKPGSLMPALGRGEYDARTGMTVTAGGLDDQQVADIAAYLQALK
ncbi:MAG TPA: cytochrome c oxidase subunit II [Gemmatimonadaceae bacterium]